MSNLRFSFDARQREEVHEGFLRGLLLSLVITLLLALLVTIAGLGVYVYFAMSLPPPEELSLRAARFANTKIYDREGRLLYEIFDPTGGRRTVVPLQDIPLYLRQATIATEDATFYSNPGFNPFSILRAAWQNITEREIVSGASGITQQLVKNLFLSPEVTLSRKIKEAVLAAEITRRYPKDTILEIYLNQIYYGNLAYGVEAAAETYFGKPVSELTLAEAALLAGIPQSPAIYDPYTNPEGAKARQAVVLDLMAKEGYITRAQADAALAEELHYAPQTFPIRAPHFVMYVRELLEQKYGTEMLYRGGLKVYTTLDSRMQELAEGAVRDQIAALADQHATNAALVALEPGSGQILAIVGSVDFFSKEIDGQVNMTLRPRQPGSAIKPITYAAALEKGWTAATMIMDVKGEFPDGANPPYVPENFDKKEHGAVLVRDALANSHNICAVRTLQFVGLPSMLEMAYRLGITTLNRPDYGLALTLGAGEVTLLQLSAAYAALANGGHRVEPIAILRIEDANGNVLEEARTVAGEQVLDPRIAYILTSILSDDAARAPTFGANSVLKLSRPAAAKTGTTNDYTDALTVGYTPDLVAGVWVGNNDRSSMDRVPGSRGAGPIWHNFMEAALADRPPRDFVPPPGLTTAQVCPISGKLWTDKCPSPRTEIFIAGTEPTEPCDVHVEVRICTVSGRRATEFCPENVVVTQYFEAYPPEFRQWAEANGHPQPPAELCNVHTRASRAAITWPTQGQTVQGVVGIIGDAVMSDFNQYVVEYGIGQSPLGWALVGDPGYTPVEGGLLINWDTRRLKNGIYSLRVSVLDHHGNRITSAPIWVNVSNPTPTPTQSPIPTWTPLPTPTSTPEPTATPSPTWLPEPTATAPATSTPEPTPTSTPEATYQHPTPPSTPVGT
ncbi:MAG: PBP1A family penicillin-binding protein [Chloroflexi bacterium]|nr:PBP1A family penicillin-binding protein [Chloroflexota bacterium]